MSAVAGPCRGASGDELFESIMPIAVVGATVIFAVRYARSESAFVGTGLLLGVIFLAVSAVLDLLLFTWGPMKMGFVDYLKDIGLTYLIMPIVTYGMGRVAPQPR